LKIKSKPLTRGTPKASAQRKKKMKLEERGQCGKKVCVGFARDREEELNAKSNAH